MKSIMGDVLSPKKPASIEKPKPIKTKYAGYIRRTPAILIDLIIVIIISFPSIFIARYSENLASFTSMSIYIAYFTFCHASKWQATPGKMLLSIYVTDKNGEKISLFRSFIRIFLFTAMNMPIWFFIKSQQELLIANINDQKILSDFMSVLVIFSIFTYFIIYISIWFSKQKTSLYDIISNTRVMIR